MQEGVQAESYSTLHQCADFIENHLIDNRRAASKNVSLFHAKRNPPMLLFQFIQRIRSVADVEDSTLIYAIALMKKLKDSEIIYSNKEMYLLYFTLVYISAKINEDSIFSGTKYAKMIGYSLQKLSELEKAILDVLDYKLIISTTEYRSVEKLIKF